MRFISKIIIHCSATKPDQDIGLDEIRKWHLKRGFNDIGYHYVVRLNGTMDIGRPIERVGAHVRGHNKESIGICYVGGLNYKGIPEDTRLKCQKEQLIAILKQLKEEFPTAEIIGHNDISSKACPCFDAKEEYKHL